MIRYTDINDIEIDFETAIAATRRLKVMEYVEKCLKVGLCPKCGGNLVTALLKNSSGFRRPVVHCQYNGCDFELSEE